MVTRSGCASADRLKGRCPLISAKVGIGHTNSGHFGGGVNCLGQGSPQSYARGWRRPPPPQRLHPSGGDGCQGWSSVRKWPNDRFRNFAGTGATPAPLRSDHRRGRRMPAGRPQSRVLAATERQRDETRVVALLHSDQDGALALGPRRCDDLAHIRWCGDGFPGNLENDVTCREPVICRNAA